jgi:hypothetical protein
LEELAVVLRMRVGVGYERDVVGSGIPIETSDIRHDVLGAGYIERSCGV